MTEYKLLKDWNPQVGDVFETEHGSKRIVDTPKTARTVYWGNGTPSQSFYWFEFPVRRVSRATPDMSKNERAYAFLSDAEKQVLRDAEGIIAFINGTWYERTGVSTFIDGQVYRTKPKPQRINIKDLTGTVELDDDGKPKWDSYEA